MAFMWSTVIGLHVPAAMIAVVTVEAVEKVCNESCRGWFGPFGLKNVIRLYHDWCLSGFWCLPQAQRRVQG